MNVYEEAWMELEVELEVLLRKRRAIEQLNIEELKKLMSKLLDTAWEKRRG